MDLDLDLDRRRRDPTPRDGRAPIPRRLLMRSSYFRSILVPVPVESQFSLAKGFDRRRRAPSSLPLPGASLRSRIQGWEDVLSWLRDLMDAIEESLNKDLDDVSALKREFDDHRSASFDMLQLDLVQKPDGPRPPVVDGYAADDLGFEELRPIRADYDNLTEWGRWEQQQQDLQTCQLEKLFYGPKSLPSNILIPSSSEMVEISAFVEAHECYLFKYWDHLEYLLGLVGDTLVPQVESKLDELKLQELGHLKKRSDLMGGITPNQPITVDWAYPESEDEYPDGTADQEDEEDDYPDAKSLFSRDDSSNPDREL